MRKIWPLGDMGNVNWVISGFRSQKYTEFFLGTQVPNSGSKTSICLVSGKHCLVVLFCVSNHSFFLVFTNLKTVWKNYIKTGLNSAGAWTLESLLFAETVS